MIPLTIGVAIFAVLLWFSTRFERHIRIWLKRHEEKIELTPEMQATLIQGCDLLMEIHPDPQSDEHRTALDLKLRLEKALRE